LCHILYLTAITNFEVSVREKSDVDESARLVMVRVVRHKPSHKTTAEIV